MALDDYLSLIPASNAKQANFVATITLDVSAQIRVQELMSAMLPLFNLSTPPRGNQLDIIGKWVGVSRNVTTPINNVYFSWDSDANLGWDYGSWQPSDEPAQITSLPDDAYLILIQTKIAANTWSGTTDDAYDVWNRLLSGTGITILIQDHQDMSYAMGIVGDIIPPITLALITGGYIQLRPEGVEITEYFVGPAPFFSWDTDSTNLMGWDEGKWAEIVEPT